MKHFFVAGFDFGTSYSKVVLRDQLTGVAKAVTFGEKESGLLPSFVGVGDGILVGPESQKWELLLPYPKLIAADAAGRRQDFFSLYHEKLGDVHKLLGTSSLEQVARLALIRFFLSVINAVHEFISKDADWCQFDFLVDPVVVQIAVPTGLSIHDDNIDLFFQSALVAATRLRLNRGHSSSNSSVEELETALIQISSLEPSELENLNNRCITYPEVAAGVQAVLRHPTTPAGKYVTLDVGAGTVDLNAFYRHPAGGVNGSTLDYWSCIVQPLGSARLDLGKDHWDRAPHEVTVNALSGTDLMKRLNDALSKLMAEAFRYQPKAVRGNGDSPWQRNTFAYIWGGGSSHRPYEETFLKALRDLDIGVHDINRLPHPLDQLCAPKDVDFGRLAVAFGLSFHKANLETVRLPNQLATFDDLYPDYWRDIIPQSKLCSCWANPTCVRCHGTGFITVDEAIAPPVHFIAQDTSSSRIRTTQRRPPSRFEVVLARCIKRYIDEDTPLIEKLLLLNRVNRLYRSPRVRLSGLSLRWASNLLSSNVSSLKGTVRIRSRSAREIPGGCTCLLFQARPLPPLLKVVLCEDPLHLHNVISHHTQPYLEVVCGVRKTNRGDFLLTVTAKSLRRCT